MIYFIRQEPLTSNCGCEKPMLKIGKSNRPFKRLKSFATGNPNQLTMLLILRPPRGITSYELENYFHSRFSRERLGDTEWFHISKRLDSFISDNQSGNDEYTVYYPPRSRLSTWLKWAFITFIILAGLCAASLILINYFTL